jgi:hypothetical protein
MRHNTASIVGNLGLPLPRFVLSFCAFRLSGGERVLAHSNYSRSWAMSNPEELPSGASKPTQKGKTYRTDRALPKPDMSSATEIVDSIVLLKIRIRATMRVTRTRAMAHRMGRLTEFDCVTAGRFAMYFLPKNASNTSKSPNSDEKIQGIPRKSKPQVPAKEAKLRPKQGMTKDFKIPGGAAEAPRPR